MTFTADSVLASAVAQNLGKATDFRGCSPEEIASLERLFSVQILPPYRRYLELMGHSAGLVFRWDHLAVNLAHVIQFTESERAKRGDAIPDDALIICSRLGEQFEFLRCNNGDDAIYYYNEDDISPRIEFTSFDEWLEAQLDSAVDAVESGYFEDNPEGTEP